LVKELLVQPVVPVVAVVVVVLEVLLEEVVITSSRAVVKVVHMVVGQVVDLILVPITRHLRVVTTHQEVQ
jgi:hypothetical protein